MRCDQCQFWDLTYQHGEQQKKHADDRVGGCHRHAPRPTLGEYEYMTLHALILIAKPTDEEALYLYNFWEEALQEECTWPCTMGSSWCGEFKEKA
jgi:hypothetical protein